MSVVHSLFFLLNEHVNDWPATHSNIYMHVCELKCRDRKNRYLYQGEANVFQTRIAKYRPTDRSLSEKRSMHTQTHTINVYTHTHIIGINTLHAPCSFYTQLCTSVCMWFEVDAMKLIATLAIHIFFLTYLILCSNCGVIYAHFKYIYIYMSMMKQANVTSRVYVYVFHCYVKCIHESAVRLPKM